MKKIIILFLILPLFIFSQTKETEVPITKSYLEIVGIPPFLLSAGVGIKCGLKTEHVLSGNVFVPILFHSGGLRYNFNYIFKQKKNYSFYLPFWSGIRNVYFYPGGEGDGAQNFYWSAGTGIGSKIKITKKHFAKIELGAGAALNYFLPNRLSPRKYYFQNYQLDKSFPVIPSLHLNIRYIIPFK